VVASLIRPLLLISFASVCTKASGPVRDTQLDVILTMTPKVVAQMVDILVFRPLHSAVTAAEVTAEDTDYFSKLESLYGLYC